MRYTDLAGAAVYTSDGERVGTVRDAGFEQWRLADGRTEFRLSVLECGDRQAIGHRFGYGKGNMAGPWPLDRLFARARQRLSIVIPWRDIADATAGRIDLRVTAAQLRAREKSS